MKPAIGVEIGLSQYYAYHLSLIHSLDSECVDSNEIKCLNETIYHIRGQSTYVFLNL